MFIYNAKKTDTIAGGQMFDDDNLLFLIARDLDIKKLEFFKLIKDFWQKYHLNELQAGTLKQTEFLKKKESKGDFSQDCKTLEKEGLLIDRGYKYGSKWLFKPIDKDDLNKLYWAIKYKILS